MKFRYLILIPAVLTATISIAQSPTTKAITEDVLKQIKSSLKKDASTKALINAVSNNDPKTLILNRENVKKVDHNFSNVVKSKGITNQKSSGRCWLFTGLNVFRPMVINKLGLEEFEFSQNYSFFYDQLEKANLFLEGIISTKDKPMDDRTVEWFFKNPIGDGGLWSGFADIVQKYGLVPKEAMPETYNSDNTGVMRDVLEKKLREDGLLLRDLDKKKETAETFQKRKIEMLCEVYRILVLNLGEPPTEFEWRYKGKDGVMSESKTYTPKSFYTEFVSINMNDYILFMDDPTREYNKVYEIEYDRNMVEGTNWKYINLPAAKIKEFAKQSIIGNEAMYFSCDVGKQLNANEGSLDLNNYDYESLYGVGFTMNKAQRIMTFESGSSHGMALTGVDIDKTGKIVKWQLENSWGADKGHKGFLTMTDKWFDEYMFRLVVNKKYVDEKSMNLLKQKPIMLPPWDPMFAKEE